MRPFLLIGNPENRRIQGFVEALRRAGAPEPTVLAHVDLLDEPTRLERLPDTPRFVRLESVGENAEVERRLLDLGADAPGAPPTPLARHGAVRAPRRHHVGFLRYLARLDAVFSARPAWRVLTPVPAIVRLFDKAALWRQHADAGLPVPEALWPPPAGVDELRDRLRSEGWRSAYVKLTCGSSASGLALFTVDPAERVMTTLVRREGGWFNSLRVRRVVGRADIDEVLGFVLSEGAHVERAVPKARLDGAVFDLRVLVVDGAPAFTVVRQSRHPITNLHLGGWRGDLAALERAAPPEVLDAVHGSCLRAAELQGCFHLGVDVLVEPRFRGHRLLEANAFGDLIPNLSYDGRDVYAHQIWRLRQGEAPPA